MLNIAASQFKFVHFSITNSYLKNSSGLMFSHFFLIKLLLIWIINLWLWFNLSNQLFQIVRGDEDKPISINLTNNCYTIIVEINLSQKIKMVELKKKRALLLHTLHFNWIYSIQQNAHKLESPFLANLRLQGKWDRNNNKLLRMVYRIRRNKNQSECAICCKGR